MFLMDGPVETTEPQGAAPAVQDDGKRQRDFGHDNTMFVDESGMPQYNKGRLPHRIPITENSKL